MLPEPYYSRDGITIYHGDCLAILPELPSGSVDAVVTDPPYGIGLRNGDVDGHRSERDFDVIGDENQAVGLEVLAWASNLPAVVFASPWKPWPGEWRNLIVWDKGGAVGGGGDIRTCLKRSWELIQVARNYEMNGPRSESVWQFPMLPRDTAEHICAKPVDLMIALVTRFTDAYMTILDPFLGSGTTAVACIKTGRKCIGIELSEDYCKIAARRCEEAFDAQGLYRQAEETCQPRP